MYKINLLIGIIVLLGVIASCEDPVNQDTPTNFDLTKYQPYVDLYFYNYDSLPNDPIFVQDYKLEGSNLKVIVGYSGCSGNHPIELVLMHPSCGTPPIPPPTFSLRHDGIGQLCDRYVTDTVYFDLSNVIDSTKEETQIQFCYHISGADYQCDSLALAP